LSRKRWGRSKMPTYAAQIKTESDHNRYNIHIIVYDAKDDTEARKVPNAYLEEERESWTEHFIGDIVQVSLSTRKLGRALKATNAQVPATRESKIKDMLASANIRTLDDLVF
jgi:hypothetical protein